MLVCATQYLLRSLSERVYRLCFTFRAVTHISGKTEANKSGEITPRPRRFNFLG